VANDGSQICAEMISAIAEREGETIRCSLIIWFGREGKSLCLRNLVTSASKIRVDHCNVTQLTIRQDKYPKNLSHPPYRRDNGNGGFRGIW